MKHGYFMPYLEIIVSTWLILVCFVLLLGVVYNLTSRLFSVLNLIHH